MYAPQRRDGVLPFAIALDGRPSSLSDRAPSFDSSTVYDSSAGVSHSDHLVYPDPKGLGVPEEKVQPHVPVRSWAEDPNPYDTGVKTNVGKTNLLMALLSELWMFNLVIILGGVYIMSFVLPQGYTDTEMWNIGGWWKIAWLLPLPYTLICFYGLCLPFRTTKFINYETQKPFRRVDNLYILTVTKGDNREAVYRSWNAHRHFEKMHPALKVHVLTDEPYFFDGLNCYTCPKSFKTERSKHKARALEWWRQTNKLTEHDWVLHLDEESVIDDESIMRCLRFAQYETDYHWGQGTILYNQYKYWHNWIFTVADAMRVGDDVGRFHLQYTFFHRPIFGAHGSFLFTNGAVENAVTWDLGSLTEDYQFAMNAWKFGYKCGKIDGLIREQSPQGFWDFLKQRRRWYLGIMRLPNFLPKMWGVFWTLGTVCLYATIASIPLGIVIQLDTPRWFGILKDFSFITFVYIYVLGILIQDIDKGLHPAIIILHIPMTIVLQFIAIILEALSVMYGLLRPTKQFQVIQKN
ncbi:hypothetical protein CXG81DRAFT_11644 [Caulochytrium protostelioides]|uniref:Glycosyltransferase 2-like domain-containing protein n=1 Tax=Caulochytrium protostelioides TaxID=1555241 RepID=A0A4P9WZJ6_9FUNG|nr:hypothetical protein CAUPRSCDRAFT_7154 [Caulochytrium protostelioides]RKP01704.1 hypothetical protein CXG81DRAFT_11644 [Caulochytrium protostelioides]|eukprot:RKP01704.1 hypothetical protein CXG81DRAFT_11644 [Caulochytrium protostelioides]